MRGVLNVSKPGGMTSHDVVRHLRRMLSPDAPAVGHAGTLDPLASGVLLVLVGAATKVSHLLMEQPKEYRAEVLFGTETDTDDITGRTIGAKPTPDISALALRALLKRFAGRIRQTPPRYSAIKTRGTPHYRLARKGLKVEPKPRSVTVVELELLDWLPPRALVRAVVSSGTYIRALARDLGRAAGSAATLAGLIRTRSGSFAVADSIPLGLVTRVSIEHHLVPIPEALPDVPRLELTETQARRLANGQRLRLERLPPTGRALALTPDQRFLALVTPDQGSLKPIRIVYADWRHE